MIAHRTEGRQAKYGLPHETRNLQPVVVVRETRVRVPHKGLSADGRSQIA